MPHTDIGLDPVILYEGGEGTFVCSSQEASTNVQWIVNGSSLENLNLYDETMLDTFSTGGALKFLNVPLDYSGTTVQCVITYTDGSMGSSNTATLLVQGVVAIHYNPVTSHPCLYRVAGCCF